MSRKLNPCFGDKLLGVRIVHKSFCFRDGVRIKFVKFTQIFVMWARGGIAMLASSPSTKTSAPDVSRSLQSLLIVSTTQSAELTADVFVPGSNFV